MKRILVQTAELAQSLLEQASGAASRSLQEQVEGPDCQGETKCLQALSIRGDSE